MKDCICKQFILYNSHKKNVLMTIFMKKLIQVKNKKVGITLEN